MIDLGNDKWIAVFLATRKNTNVPLTSLGRETFMAPVTWTDDGWPIIGQNGLVELEMPDIVNAKQNDLQPLAIDFSKDLSAYPYFKLRVPKDTCYIQDKQNRTLTLKGEDDLNTTLGHPTMLLFRQTQFNQTFTAKLDTKSLEGTAGVAAWLQTNYHANLSIEKKDGKLVAKVQQHIHDLVSDRKCVEVNETETLELRITATNESYSFQVNSQTIDEVSYAGLTTGCTCGNCFTGTLFGIFSEDGEATFKDRLFIE